MDEQSPAIETDVLVIGAGPAGLFQAFQLGLLGLRVEVIDALPEAGGQCTALYADKPIYDIPGIPVCTGRELTERLLAQARPFIEGRLHLGWVIDTLGGTAEAGFSLSAVSALDAQTKGPSFQARSVVVATGAGAFLPRSLNLAGLIGLRQVHHHLSDGACATWAGQDLLLAGGGDEALMALEQLLALPTAQAPRRITLLHRRAQFQAEPGRIAQAEQWIAEGRVHLAVGLPTAVHSEEGRITALDIMGADSQTTTLTCPHLLIQLGLSPKLGPLADWGLALARKQVQVDPASFASSVAGVHAVGDAISYPGKQRLILCGFHEATLAAHAISRHLQADHPSHLLYTTTSPVLHRRLGVAQG
jgi:thioredoxin reductase (NADPH)